MPNRGKGPQRPLPKGGGNKAHPTQKPVGLMEWCIGMTKLPVICDPYMGSGTTGVAAIRQGRRFVGCEIDPRHFETAVRRIKSEQAAPRLAL